MWDEMECGEAVRRGGVRKEGRSAPKLMMRRRENPHHEVWADVVIWRSVAHNPYRRIKREPSKMQTDKAGTKQNSNG